MMNDESIPGLSDDKSPRWQRFAKHSAILLGLLGLWEFVTATGIADALLFPRPSDILVSFVPLYVTDLIVWPHLWITMQTVLAGFALETIMGIGLAVLAGMSETVHRYMKPYVIVLEATPRIAMGPLMLAWLGFGFGAKLAIVTLVCFFAPFVNTLTANILCEHVRVIQRSHHLPAKTIYDWRHYLAVVQRKPGALRPSHGLPCKPLPGNEWGTIPGITACLQTVAGSHAPQTGW
jgi:hypothetical protein